MWGAGIAARIGRRWVASEKLDEVLEQREQRVPAMHIPGPGAAVAGGTHLEHDPRLGELVDAIALQADDEGRWTAGSMYRSWKGWSFTDKKRPSPWLTLLALRIGARLAA